MYVNASAPVKHEQVEPERATILKTPAQDRQRDNELERGVQGDILHLRSPVNNRGRSEGMRRNRKRTLSLMDHGGAVAFGGAPSERREVTASFMPNIDNFAGVK